LVIYNSYTKTHGQQNIKICDAKQTKPIVTKRTYSQERCVQIADTDCLRNWTRCVERRVRN